MRTYLLATALFAPSLLVAQATPTDVARERAERTHWVATDPLSPARALAIQDLGPTGISLGPDGADVRVGDGPLATLTESGGQLKLAGWGPDLSLPRERVTRVRGLRILPRGAAGRTTVFFYRDSTPGKRPLFYPYSAASRFRVVLTPTTPKPARILSPLGVSVEAMEVGTVSVTLADTARTLRVMRIAGDGEESELLINFRDGTTGHGTYPAGRFVELIPQGGDKYLLDFNRAINPNCAYSGVFPCPIPWSGNSLGAKMEAGEKYPPEGAH